MIFEITVSTGKKGNHMPDKANRWVVKAPSAYVAATQSVPDCLRQIKMSSEEEIKQVVVTASYAE